MKSVSDFFEQGFSNPAVRSVLVIACGFLVYRIISWLLLKRIKKMKGMNSGRWKTLLHLSNSALKYGILIITFLMFLQINNVNVSSLIAGLGIAGIVLGLTVQDALKDIIRGFSIISDGYFKVGDLVNYKGIEGKVLELGLKTTKIRDIRTENIVAIPNRSIEEIQVVSDYIYLNVPLPYELPLEKAEDVMQEIVRKIKMSKLVKECDYRGVSGLMDSCIHYQIRVLCGDNLMKLQINRDALRCVLTVLEQNNIAVPYPQIDVHNK